jgi:hypothetical protein
MARPSRMWSSRWKRSLAGFLMHAVTSDRHIGSGWSAVQQAPQYLPLKGGRRRPPTCRGEPGGGQLAVAMISKYRHRARDPHPTAFAPAQGRGKCCRPPPFSER